ncbi:MAG: 50S ribosomal protein L1 [Candidatus Omnitrophica bacterium]|nr:50S ribosomal protein L1 [Candidatus Omnitrophota bacterium]
MAKLTKRQKKINELVDKDKLYSLNEAVSTLKKFPQAKFDETVELSFNLHIDPKQSDQLVRGTVILPHGTGKSVRVLVFCKGEDVKKAEAAEADFVGSDELIKKINGGWMDFDVIVATPEMMRDISKLGRVLGPRGLMPSPKAGTVTKDIEKAVKELKGGKIEFKNSKNGNIYLAIGKISFDEAALADNAGCVIEIIKKSKPAVVKGVFIKGIFLATTMGCGLKIAV